MAPANKKEEDFEFIMTCLVHTNGLPKPDFEKVAAATGAKDAKTCYHKHWRIMNEWGLTSKRGKQSKATDANGEETATPSVTEPSAKKRKRASPKTTAKSTTAVVDIEDDVEEVVTPVKKVKSKANGDGPKIEVKDED